MRGLLSVFILFSSIGVFFAGIPAKHPVYPAHVWATSYLPPSSWK